MFASEKKHAAARSAGMSALLCALLVGGITTAAHPAYAATLGPISVLSSLGEPLSAEIEIFDLSAEEADELDVALASEMEFDKSGASRTAQMDSLTLRIVQQGRRRLIQLTTDKPLHQPIYGLLLELRTEVASTVAEFAVLPEEAVKPVDAVAGTAAKPVEADTQTAPDKHAPALSVSETSGTVEASEAASSATTADTFPTEAAATGHDVQAVDVAGRGAENLALSQNDPMQHLVQRGDNLTRIARQHAVPPTALDKFIAATYEVNPDAFMNQNLHYLKAGAVLALPSDDVLSQIDEKIARRQIATQWQAFQGMVAKKEGSSDDAGNRSSSKPLTAGSTNGRSAKGDRLTLAALKPGDADAHAKTEEEAIAARKAAEEASERVRLLERNILELKTAVQPPGSDSTKGSPAENPEDASTGNSVWGILASPARDLVMQVATVLLLGALVVMGLLRRNAK